MATSRDTQTATRPPPAWRTRAGSVLGLVAATLLVAAGPARTAPVGSDAPGARDASGVVRKPFFLSDGPPGKAAAQRELIRAMARSQTLASDMVRAMENGPGTTIPYWSTAITSPLDGQTYQYSMVGSSPYDAHPINTNVTYVPVVVRVHFTSPQVKSTQIRRRAYTLDPTVNGNCDSQPVATRFFNSPIFKSNYFNSNGVNVSATPGGQQLGSALQRANFWSAVRGTNYGVTLVPSRSTPIVVDYNATGANDSVYSAASACSSQRNPLGYVEINEYDTLVNQIATQYATPTQIPVVLVYNVVLYQGTVGNCCIGGYHSATQYFDTNNMPTAVYTYAVGGYVDPTVFGADSGDVNAWGHEIAELLNDPFVQSVTGVPGDFNNGVTPAWGHTGQVSACQNNLEVGDPADNGQLGSYPGYSIVGVGGFNYHHQDEAFHDWFYRTPSTSAGGKGSFKGNLAAGGQGVCS